MYSRKILLAAATTAILSAGGISVASAAPPDPQPDRHPARHEVHRPTVARDHVVTVLRDNHYRVLGDPYFVHGHYVVRAHNGLGRVVFVEVDPHTGAFIRKIRL